MAINFSISLYIMGDRARGFYKMNASLVAAAARVCTDWSQEEDAPDAEWKGFRTANCTGWRIRSSTNRVAPFNDPSRPLGIGYWLANSGLPEVLLVLRPLLEQQHWQMCYGGSFATRREHIRRWPVALWQWFATQLSRGDNIAEGHYMARLWAALLAPPLSATREQAFLCAVHSYSSSYTWSKDRPQVKTYGYGYGHAIGCSCHATCHRPHTQKFLGLRRPARVSWTLEKSD